MNNNFKWNFYIKKLNLSLEFCQIYIKAKKNKNSSPKLSATKQFKIFKNFLNNILMYSKLNNNNSNNKNRIIIKNYNLHYKNLLI